MSKQVARYSYDRQLAPLYAQLQSALAGGERIFELVDTQPDRYALPHAAVGEHFFHSSGLAESAHLW
jgi:hypothetical protein